ncbi:hypothetical protein CFP56_005426 [Quercus suber]|uniref:Uncharacterized protein n=1 Tax=Quercus suber TaxID=58331 RepID=A0AAW0LAX4_QUESU
MAWENKSHCVPDLKDLRWHSILYHQTANRAHASGVGGASGEVAINKPNPPRVPPTKQAGSSAATTKQGTSSATTTKQAISNAPPNSTISNPSRNTHGNPKKRKNGSVTSETLNASRNASRYREALRDKLAKDSWVGWRQSEEEELKKVLTFKLGLGATVYHIWKLRNPVLHKGCINYEEQIRSERDVVGGVSLKVSEKMSSVKRFLCSSALSLKEKLIQLKHLVGSMVKCMLKLVENSLKNFYIMKEVAKVALKRCKEINDNGNTVLKICGLLIGFIELLVILGLA